MKNNLKFIFIFIFVLSSCGIKINLSVAESFDFHTNIQYEYLSSDDVYTLPDNVKGIRELSIPSPLTLCWDDIPDSNYEVYVSEDNQFTNPTLYTTKNNYYELYNFKINTTYFIKISNGKSNSDINEVTINSSKIRNIYLDGVTNVRDLGGKVTLNNKTIKQGMLYRGAALEGITSFGKNEFINNLKIKTEIDLRYEGEIGKTSLPCVPNINYYECPLYFNKLIDSKEIIRNVFSYLENIDNYPIYYHCTIGTDRTGYISFLINAILGLSIDDIYLDYLFSNFAKIGGSRNKDSINHYVNLINDCEGSDLLEKTENFLDKYYQISEKTINNIRNLLLE